MIITVLYWLFFQQKWATSSWKILLCKQLTPYLILLSSSLICKTL